MILSDRSIKQEIKDGRIIIDPYDESCVQPASLDVHLDATFVVFQPWEYPHYIDLRQPLDKLSRTVMIGKEQFFSLQPGQFVLASTIENIELPDDLMARLEGKSSLGRVGLLIHATAGYVDPGWKGTLTLELYNVSPMPIHLYPEMKISGGKENDCGQRQPESVSGRPNYIPRHHLACPSPLRYHTIVLYPAVQMLVADCFHPTRFLYVLWTYLQQQSSPILQAHTK